MVLSRAYDYAGHVVRYGSRNNTLVFQVLMQHCRAECREMSRVIGHQGHPGRHAPWSWELQYDSFFVKQGIDDWKDVAMDKTTWLSHKADWMRFRLGKRCAHASMGRIGTD